jgi:hypothetical protein
MADSGSDFQVKSHIPFFFYDVIGRMMPGAYLIIGVMLCYRPFFHWEQFVSFLNDTKALSMSGGLATVVVGAGLLFFAFVSSFFGFLLAALSYVAIEKWFWHSCPLNQSGLVKFIGIENVDSLNARFKEKFGSEPTKDSLNRSSFLCAYYIWRTDNTLGEMQGRFDADLLATQSFVLVSAILIVTVLIEIYFLGISGYFEAWLAVLILISLASGLAFNYHRKKRVYGRFGLFLAISDAPSAKK